MTLQQDKSSNTYPQQLISQNLDHICEKRFSKLYKCWFLSVSSMYLFKEVTKCLGLSVTLQAKAGT